MKKNNLKFQYKSINDPKYIKDRDELFKEHGNGWFRTAGMPPKRKRR